MEKNNNLDFIYFYYFVYLKLFLIFYMNVIFLEVFLFIYYCSNIVNEKLVFQKMERIQTKPN